MSPAHRRGPRAVRHVFALVALSLCGSAFAQVLLPEALTVFPANVRPGSPLTITATLHITNPLFIQGSAVLNELDGNGKVLRRLATFADNGTGRDEVAGDQIYTAHFSLLPAQVAYHSVVGSIALKGVMQRITTVSAQIWVSADTDPTAPIATVEEAKVVFRDSSGQQSDTLLLDQYVETTVETPDGQVFETRHETAIASESQGAVVVLSHGISLDDGANEGDNLPTKLRYYSASGTQHFELSSAQGRVFFLDGQRRMLSREGDRILVIEVGDDETQPSVEVFNAAGQSLFKLEQIVGMEFIAQAAITSNGRYVGLIGGGVLETDTNYLIVVIDIENDVMIERLTPRNADAPYPVLAENQTGSLTLIIGSSGEQLPW